MPQTHVLANLQQAAAAAPVIPIGEDNSAHGASLHGENAARRQAITELLFFASVGDVNRCKKICKTWRIQVLVLAAAAHLHAATSAAACPPDTRQKLVQLLELLASSELVVSCIRATAARALHQPRTPLVTLSRATTSLPSFLGSNINQQHCFSWLVPGPTGTSSSGGSTLARNNCSKTPAVICGAGDGAAAAQPTRPDALAQADACREQQQGSPHVQQEHQQAAKRIKLADGMPVPSSTAAAAVAAAAPFQQQPNGEGPTAQLSTALQQLQTFADDCDACHLDRQLLCGALEAAAASPSCRGAGHASALQQQLQQLPVDALQPLVDLLLPAGSNSSGGGPVQLSAAGLASLLSAALLPKLQQLEGAAPKALHNAVTAAAVAEPDVLASVVLQPLLVARGAGLVAVQTQLLVKLAKEVAPLQPRLLQLLLLAASVQRDGSGPVAVLESSSTGCCCWCEGHAVLMRALLESCPQVLADRLDAVLQALQAAARQPGLAKSAAFGQLLMAVLKSFAAVLSHRQVAGLAAAAGATSSFLTKAMNSKLQQLLKQHEAVAAL